MSDGDQSEGTRGRVVHASLEREGEDGRERSSELLDVSAWFVSTFLSFVGHIVKNWANSLSSTDRQGSASGVSSQRSGKGGEA